MVFIRGQLATFEFGRESTAEFGVLPLVHSSGPVGSPLCSREKLPSSQGAMFWLLKATATIEFALVEESAWLEC